MTRSFKGFIMKSVIGVLGVLLIAGCSTGSIIQAGGDTYSVTSTGAGFSTDSVRSNVYASANEFCAKQGLDMSETYLNTQPDALGRNPPNADLKFRCIKKGSTALHEIAKPADTLTQLQSLKGLLDSGALTQNEFNTQKAKLLAE